MRRPLFVGSIALAVLGSGLAIAETPANKMPPPQKAAQETKALMPIAADMKWTGRFVPDAMGKGSPAIETRGTQDCRWTVDNLWLTCEVKATVGTGKEASNYITVVTLGYDYASKEYRAVAVGNSGCSMMMNGQIEGNKLALTSMVDQVMNGKSTKVRMTFDWSNPKAIKWTDETAVDGGEFRLMQEATMTPTKVERPSA